MSFDGTCPQNSAKLAIVGSFLATVGDALSTYAAIIALDESAAADAEQARQFQLIQQQLDEIKSVQQSQCVPETSQQISAMQQQLTEAKLEQQSLQLQLILDQIQKINGQLAKPGEECKE